MLTWNEGKADPKQVNKQGMAAQVKEAIGEGQGTLRNQGSQGWGET